MTIRNIMPFAKRSLPVRRIGDDPFSLMRREMDSLFENFYRGFDLDAFEGDVGFSPRVDVSEDEKTVTVSAELPGMDEKEIDVSVQADSLTIKGEKKAEGEDRGKGYYRLERSYGSFIRTIPIPAEVETDKIEAKFTKGVLTVTLPKNAETVEATKKISIKAE